MKDWAGDFKFSQVTETAHSINDKDWERVYNPLNPEFIIGCNLGIYLVVGRKTALIDTGIPETPREKIFSYAKSVGVKPSDIKYVLNTHGHNDHMGGNAYVKEHSGAEIAAHPLIVNNRHSYEYGGVSVDVPLKDGSKIELGNGVVLKVFHTPGHTPEDICFYNEEEKTLFVGDVLQGRRECVHVGHLGFISNAEEYEKSLHHIAKMDVEMLFDTHWNPLERDKIQECIENCLERSKRTEKIIHSMLVQSEGKTNLEDLYGNVCRELFTRINPVTSPAHYLYLDTIRAYIEKVVSHNPSMSKYVRKIVA